ncbi:Uncharacterized protein SCF082_LOCUS24739 [Durusdinium trenchii]|uniref:Uncharacterized protein n=1 Tax=Durusdinium trenchii TaxID=1381693 RepID=A0ABP0LSL8_9DINO
MVQVTVQTKNEKELNNHLLRVELDGRQKFMELQPKCQIDFPDTPAGERTATVDIYQKVGSCTLKLDSSSSSLQQCRMPGWDMTVQASSRSSSAWNSLFGWCNTSEEVDLSSVSAVPVQEGAVVPDEASGPRLLVLTDVGEEIDDEASLWLLHQHLNAFPTAEADIVFVTGSPLERATRWAQVLNSLPAHHKLTDRIQYYVGPTTSRHMRYRMMADAAELLSAGLATLINKPFEGGLYDVVLQISPISGFSADFANPPPAPLGALAAVEPRPGAQGLLYIVVGGEGATNFPRDELHIGFKKLLIEKGFQSVHVEKANYLNWDKDMFETFPPKLTELVLDDEWNKAVGRIPPMVANLFVRFRVNTLVNYEVVDRAFAAFEEDLRGTPDYVKATAWWVKVEKKVLQDIKSGYIKKSREADNKSKDCFGNGTVGSKVKGMKMSWESIMSRICVRDILASTDITETTFATNGVDEVMCHAVTLMTSKLLRIYAFNRFVSGRDPDVQQLEPYLVGTKDTLPLDFRNFPELHGDISAIQKEVVGNPMYDPAGMLVALGAMGATEKQVTQISQKLQNAESLMTPEMRTLAMKEAYAGAGQEALVEKFFPTTFEDMDTIKTPTSPYPRLLFITDAGDEADNEAALWLLSTQLEKIENARVDVVFATGQPSLRAMRWARILNSIKKDIPGGSRIRYCVAPETKREMRYYTKFNADALKRAGMGNLAESVWEGGRYNIIIQASPLEGFDDNFAKPSSSPEGALQRVEASTLQTPLIYIVVGEEGTPNFPKDKLHREFKKHLTNKGFKVLHLGPNNYMHWTTGFFPQLPSVLAKEALQDEWKKAVGRIPPEMSNVFVRFKVNTNVNYVVVDVAYKSFTESRSEDDTFKQAMAWWAQLRPSIRQEVMDNYVKVSRQHDNTGAKIGNPKIKDNVKGQQSTWRSNMATVCVEDIKAAGKLSNEALENMSVDEVLGLALTEITGKLLRIYAFGAFSAGVVPNNAQCKGYVSGSALNPPLDFYQFPRLLGDVSVLKKEVVGNPMYDTSAVLFSLCLFSAAPAQVEKLLNKAAAGSVLQKAERDEVLVRAFRGEALPDLLERLIGNS